MKVIELLAEGFEEIEALTPVDYLRRAGIETAIVGVGQTCNGSGGISGGHKIRIECDFSLTDCLCSNAKSDLPDAIIIPGGLNGAKNIAKNQAAMSLFNDVEEESDITSIKDLPGVDERVAEILESNGISDLSDFMSSYENISVEGVSKADLEKIYDLIKENVEFVEEESDLQEESSQQEQEEKYYCPECGAEITLDMTHCPKCGVEFEFEEDEE